MLKIVHNNISGEGEELPVVLSSDPTLSQEETVWWTKLNFLD